MSHSDNDNATSNEIADSADLTHADGKDDGVRRSERSSKPTEAMSQYMADESVKREQKLLLVYDRWRTHVRDCRKSLKLKPSDEELGNMLDSVAKHECNVVDYFEHLRYTGAPKPTIVRKVDACIAISRDIVRTINEMLSGVDDVSPPDFRSLKANEYSGSVFSDLTRDTAKSSIPDKVLDAAADLAVRKAELESIKIEEEHQTKFEILQEQQRKLIDAHQREMKKLQAERYIAVAEAKLRAYSDILQSGEIVKSEPQKPPPMSEHDNGKSFNPAISSSYNATSTTHVSNMVPTSSVYIGHQGDITNVPTQPTNTTSYYGHSPVIQSTIQPNLIHHPNPPVIPQLLTPNASVPVGSPEAPGQSVTSDLAKAFADSVNLNRLPVPEPAVFTGDPLKYVEWKTSFCALIERKGVLAQEKIFYLKKYVGGEARHAIDGFLYSGSASAFESAKEVLDDRYGHPFVMQKAFRSKLENWPKVGERDSKALRDFGDFLKACQDAIPQIPSLKILDDCTENQRLLSKLPNWAALRWNRQVQESLDACGNYPSFRRFVEFVVKEARIACNPVSSLHAIHDLDQGTREHKIKGHRANTNAITTSDQSKYNAAIGRSKPCEFCGKDGHPIYKCHGFTPLTIDKKRSVVRTKRLCFGCLNKGHLNKDCKRKHICNICKGKHPTCMHEDAPPLGRQPPPQDDEATPANALRVSRRNGQGTSMIVPVWVSMQANPSHEILTYALLDTQSDTTFILNEISSALHASAQPIRLSLSTMTSQNTVINSSKVCNLQVRGFRSSDAVSINHAYTRDFIPADRSHIPVGETVKGWEHLRQLTDELPPLQSCEVGLLIGYNCPQALAPKRFLTGKNNEPYAIQTRLGWSVVGYTGSVSSDSFADGITLRASVKELPIYSPKDAIKALEADFAHDKHDDVKLSQEDIQFVEFLDKTIHQREDKHVEMPLPFKDRPMLPNNRPLALIRLGHLKRKLQRDNKYHEHYKKFMDEIINRGDAELVESSGVEGNEWYIPHHGVYHNRKPDKLRVVFDCSASYKGDSLNDHLLTGPDLTNGLAGVLCRFRRYPVAVMCDIEKMFHQFFVTTSDRDFLRFLWWESGDIDGVPLEYRMRVHLFGAASSPGCANYGLKYLATIQEKSFPEASSFVQHDFYVDDGLTSVKTEDEAIQLVNDARTLCANGGLRLHKFISNSKRVIDSVPLSERAAEVKDLDLALEQLPVEQALGVRWCVEEDVFNFKIANRSTEPTRRNMLSIVASIFDPLGFLSPFTLSGKIILQEMCQSGVGWDDQLPNERKPEWEHWSKDIQNLDLVKIPRCLIPNDFGKPTSVELHHFSDASNTGYGQCSYLRLVCETDVKCALLMGKARVAPLKVVTIPRLELTAAVLSVKVSLFLRKELNLHIDKEYFWTDSRVVLGYINNESRRFHIFVANRVQMIRDATDPNQWFYVDSNNNPADHASRGLRAAEISSSTWLTGPSFLWKRQLETKNVDTELQLGDPEVKSARSLCINTSLSSSILELLKRFSSWPLVVSVFARLQRLSNGVKGRHTPTVTERQTAEKAILLLVQRDAFSDSINALETSGTVPRTNSLHPFDPILQDGLLRVGGRLRKSELSFPFKHPILLPKDGHITRLILAHAHNLTYHQGRGITLNKLRSLGFWIVSGSKVVASFIRRCVLCRRLRRPTETQKMADLPQDRVESTPPFTYCGMDCFGPFLVKQGRKEVKRYGLLFTCMCSRAVHIEMLDDMSTDCFINGLRCFIALRGAVRQIRSDQGSNFVGAKNEFVKRLNSEQVTSFLADRQCDFLMNAPSSSHTGGVWERQIRTVRNILSAVLQLCPGRLDDSSLRTVFYEVMSIVNCRPLTVSEIDDPKTLEPLTPNHILTAKSSIPYPPPGEFVKEDLFLRKRWKRVQYLLEQFWSRWRKEYMGQISLRQKWHEPRRNVREGDIVLVKDVELPRNRWPLARVVEANPDDDALVRRVKVRLSSGILERSVHKLVVLVEK